MRKLLKGWTASRPPPFRYSVLIHVDETCGYVAEVPQLPGCLTQADSWPELLLMIGDAQKAWLEAAKKNGDRIPEPYHGQVRPAARKRRP